MSEWGKYAVEVEGLTREQMDLVTENLTELLARLELYGARICRWLPPKQGDSDQ
jgi:hypothetical protein